MKVELKSIVDGIEFQTDESESFLNKLSAEILTISDEEIQLPESEDVSDQPEWMQEIIKTVKKHIKLQENYLTLPSKYEFHEYSLIEDFIMALPIEEQRNEMYILIKGKGAFSKFNYGLDRFLLRDKWYKFRDNALFKLAKNWCNANGIEIK